ncbi:MAG: hypothetical protein HY650_01080 [Acidobacteria bacterium]|nr:hypothetical protein [Acidobacteriota bacterium]
MKKTLAALAMLSSVVCLFGAQVLPKLGFITVALTNPEGATAESLSLAYVLGGILYIFLYGFDLGLVILIL